MFGGRDAAGNVKIYFYHVRLPFSLLSFPSSFPPQQSPTRNLNTPPNHPTNTHHINTPTKQQRTAHPTLPEIRILAYLWIRRTFPPMPTPSTLTPNPSLTGPATPPASNTAHPYATRSRKRKREQAEEISDDVTRLQGTSGGAEMGTGGLGRGGKMEGVAVVVMGEWLCMNR